MATTYGVYLGMPLYEGRADIGAAWAASATASKNHRVLPGAQESGLIPTNCTELWCKALNLRENGFQRFAMLHADVQPESWWLDRLIDEADRHNADFLSAVIPIKPTEPLVEDYGLTSTAIARPNVRIGFFRRLTLSRFITPTSHRRSIFRWLPMPWRGCRLSCGNPTFLV